MADGAAMPSAADHLENGSLDGNIWITEIGEKAKVT